MVTDYIGRRWLRGAATIAFVCAAVVPALAQNTSTPSSGSSAPAAAPAAASEPDGYLGEPGFLTRGINYLNRFGGEGSRGISNGIYPVTSIVTGAGWVTAGGGYRHRLFNDQAFVEGSGAVSWRMYKQLTGRFEMPYLGGGHFIVGSEVVWRDLTQVTYFGAGPDSSEDTRSEYQMRYADIVGYTSQKPRPWFTLTERIGWLHRPTLGDPVGTFKRGNPSAFVTFPSDPALSLSRQPNYLHGEASATIDTRDSRSHPRAGGLYRGSWTVYSDRDTNTFSFNRYEAEAAQFIPTMNDRVVFALHGWVAGTDLAPGKIVPLYMMPSLGGHSSLRAYSNFRFHDNNMAVVNLEARIALWTHLDAAVFMDAGNVATKFSRLNLDKRDYGVGFGLHTDRASLARLDIAHGADGWKFVFNMSDPFHLSRLSRRAAAVPFVQ